MKVNVATTVDYEIAEKILVDAMKKHTTKAQILRDVLAEKYKDAEKKEEKEEEKENQ